MQTLRNHLTLTRLIMAWFVLTLGIAVAAPIVHPQAMEMVCTTAGSIKLVALIDDDEVMQGGHLSIDCPLCWVMAAPPPHALQFVQQPLPLGAALTLIESARIAALTGAPFPPRAPPFSS